MTDINNIQLVSSEISGLWYTYMGTSMSVCVLRYFSNHVEDNEVQDIVKHALKLSEQNIEKISKIMNEEKLTIPNGFNEQDVSLDAPRLFTDTFYLQYLTYMARIGMHNFTLVLNYVSRADIRQLFTNCINESVDLYNKLADLRLSKGVFIKAPRLEVSKEISYIQSSSFITDLFGEKRSLYNREITHLFSIMLSNIVGVAIATAFGQVAKEKKVLEYFFKGKELATEQISLISSIHINESIPLPSSSDSFVTDSTISPFSDKLMMFQMMAMNSMAIGSLGIAISETMRNDLQLMYGKFTAFILKYAKDGSDIMITQNWLEQPPQAINHENLAKVSR